MSGDEGRKASFNLPATGSKDAKYSSTRYLYSWASSSQAHFMSTSDRSVDLSGVNWPDRFKAYASFRILETM